MSNNQQLREQFDECEPNYHKLKEAVEYVLENEIEKNKIPYSNIYGRVKDFESFQKKVEDKAYEKPFEEIEDICGLRVVCLFPADLYKIGNLIEETFCIIKKEDKISDNPAESFGYMSIHYIATLHKSYKGAHYDDLKNLQFEIQLRTISAHAWCSVSHHLDYKRPEAVPSHLKKEFYALNALFYIADQSFEKLYSETDKAKKETEGKDINQMGEYEINYDTLSAYLASRYPDRAPARSPSVSLLAAELDRAGYRTIIELDSRLVGTDKAVQVCELDIFGVGQKRFHNVGMARNALSIADVNFDNNRIQDLRNPTIDRSQYREFLGQS